MNENHENLYIGVDVGTGSARAGVFDSSGRMLGSAEHPIKMWKPRPDFVEQGSNDIWRAVVTCVRGAIKGAKARPEAVKGIGFDATCSLVVLDEEDNPVTVSPTGNRYQNVIVWMDHRAMLETKEINDQGHEVLKYVGGVISPEMQTPKLLWIKRNLPGTWKGAARFFDLPDYLTYRATGDDTRSLCSTVCKWTYLGHEKKWDETFFIKAGLGDLASEGFNRIGTRIRPMGEAIGGGIAKKASGELGLMEGTPVGVSIIDAHAGGLGLLGMVIDKSAPSPKVLETRLALIGGTSSCHMAASREPIFVPGIWGPYFSAMIPGMWLTEGGQSATGSLIDHIIFSHIRGTELKESAKKQKKTIYHLLNNRLAILAKDKKFPALLTEDLHVLPYFHGNRSPRADATLRGVISGLRLSDTIDDLALEYLAAIQAIGYGTRHIIEEMNARGFSIDTIVACGGGTKNPVFIREHADITGCRVVLGRESEAVLLGSAVLGAVASGNFPSIMEAMAAMEAPGDIIEPEGGEVKKYHDIKYQVFHRMYDDFMAYRKMMQG